MLPDMWAENHETPQLFSDRLLIFRAEAHQKEGNSRVKNRGKENNPGVWSIWGSFGVISR